MEKNLKLYSVFLTLILILLSCNSSTEPESKNIDISEYSWEIDTLNYSNNSYFMRSIWGSDEDCIYVCGDDGNEFRYLWKYNGIKWENVPFDKYADYPNVNLETIHGSSNSNIWLGGNYRIGGSSIYDHTHKPFISHFTGSVWNVMNPPGRKEEVLSICALDYGKVLVGGDWSTIWHYNGEKWQTEKLELDVNPELNCKVQSITKFNDEMHLLVRTFDSDNIEAHYWYITGNFGNWNIINHTIRNENRPEFEFGTHGFFVSGKNLYTYRPGIWVKNNNSWNSILPEISASIPIAQVCPMGDNQFIIVSEFWEVYFYDGNKTSKINDISFENIIYIDATVVNNEIFIIGNMNYSPSSTIIIKGYLK